MSAKISLKDIASLINSVGCEGCHPVVSAKAKSGYSNFDKVTSEVLHVFLPYIMIFAIKAYYIESETSSLSSNALDELIKTKDLLNNNWNNESLDGITNDFSNEPADKEQKYIREILKKVDVLLTSSKSIIKTKKELICFNSKSSDHNRWLNRDKVSQKSKNIIIKLQSAGSEKTHIRIGLSFDKTNQVWVLEEIGTKT